MKNFLDLDNIQNNIQDLDNEKLLELSFLALQTLQERGGVDLLEAMESVEKEIIYNLFYTSEKHAYY